MFYKTCTQFPIVSLCFGSCERCMSELVYAFSCAWGPMLCLFTLYCKENAPRTVNLFASPHFKMVLQLAEPPASQASCFPRGENMLALVSALQGGKD